MDVDQLRQLEPKLSAFLALFHDCFARKDTRTHLGVYVRGQLSDLPEKSVEPIALDADVPPRTLLEFRETAGFSGPCSTAPAGTRKPWISSPGPPARLHSEGMGLVLPGDDPRCAWASSRRPGGTWTKPTGGSAISRRRTRIRVRWCGSSKRRCKPFVRKPRCFSSMPSSRPTRSRGEERRLGRPC